MATRSEQKLIIDIKKDGGTTVTVEGVKGEQCTLVGNNIAKAIGDIEADTPTEEMFERDQEQELVAYQ